jgi:hypothetical protein
MTCETLVNSCPNYTQQYGVHEFITGAMFQAMVFSPAYTVNRRVNLAPTSHCMYTVLVCYGDKLTHLTASDIVLNIVDE